ncbi:uncharacterized protein A1O9_05494 [Exophiala aquamarina CBS 119918]|uniref:Uncharacterized protein n=1 Tax=Exophiala aquamarina CBS 119918 TaxID=1182545 RepID=A0A072PCI4_9EURO|nr:uncharacterized protein A1O9_05494 [Exophiala aquamarina CBS 119918]KEF57576.1 hypothetical protein A1O9_05494 [Exophiala aquamarina CBS 119918]
MAPPDLNSLPPSRSMSSSPMQPRSMHTVTSPPNRQETPSPRSASISLASAASINAANESRRSSLSNRGSPRLGRLPTDRRRSQVAINLNLNDPSLPSPGELSSSDLRASFTDRVPHSYVSASPPTLAGRPTIATGDPHHQRQPSLGEVHNVLEQEQEAQVNRMLQMIREQQLQLDALRTSSEQSRRPSQPGNSTAVIDDLTPASERSLSFPSVHPAVPAGTPLPRRVSYTHRHSSASRSPHLHGMADGGESRNSEFISPPSPIETIGRRNSFRDESAFYQAETANLTRENQMLRMRIRELEKQISDMSTAPANTPAIPSNLVTSPPVEAEEEASAAAEVARNTGDSDKT